MYMTKRLALTLIGLVLAIGTNDGLAQSTQTAAKDLPSAESIIQKQIEAIGGEAALRALKTIEMSGIVKNDILGHTFDAEFTTTAVAPNKYRMLIQHPSFSMVQATNGEKAWVWRAGAGSDNEAGETNWMSESETKSMLERAVFNANLHWKKLFTSVQTVGVAEIGGNKAYEVRVTPVDDKPYTRYYDAESGLLLKTVRKIKSSSIGEYVRETTVDRWEKVEGVVFPVKFTHKMHIGESTGTQIHDFSEVKVNGKVARSLFQVPPELKGRKPPKDNAHQHGPHRHGHGHQHGDSHGHGEHDKG